MDPTLDAKLVKLCKSNVDGATFLDQNTSFVIDQEIYKQILLKRGIFAYISSGRSISLCLLTIIIYIYKLVDDLFKKHVIDSHTHICMHACAHTQECK